MDITVYLPNDIGQRAKAAQLPLSGMLRAAVLDELQRMEAVAEALGDATDFRLELENKDGGPYTGTFSGVLLGHGDGAQEVYLTDDERVILYDPAKLDYWEYEDADDDELAEALASLFRDNTEYMRIMNRLGISPVVAI